MAMMLRWLVCLAMGFAPLVQAVERYPLPSLYQKQQFQRLSRTLRCLVCQNQSLEDSAAPLAEDLRHEIYQRVLHHQSDKQIKQYLVSRYGDFILLSPPLTYRSAVLWVAPWMVLLAGFILLFRLGVRRHADSM